MEFWFHHKAQYSLAEIKQAQIKGSVSKRRVHKALISSYGYSWVMVFRC